MKKQIYKNKKEENILNSISEWSKTFFSQEVCGFVGIKNKEYVSFLCNNKSREPEKNFTIDPVDYIVFVDEYDPICIFHSHVLGDEEFSKHDIMMSENSCLPFLVYSLNTNKFNLHIPIQSKVCKKTLAKIKKLI